MATANSGFNYHLKGLTGSLITSVIFPLNTMKPAAKLQGFFLKITGAELRNNHLSEEIATLTIYFFNIPCI